MKPFTKIAILTATANSFLIGGYHLILPYQWGWHEHTSNLPGMIEWALYALNFLFSVLLILLASLGMFSAQKKFGHPLISQAIFGSCALFWLADIGYQLAVPLPVPSSFFFITMAFLSAAVITFFLYLYLAINIRNILNTTKS